MNQLTQERSDAQQPPEILIQPGNSYVRRLVECGSEQNAASGLVERLTAGRPADKFEKAAMRSFIDLIAALSNSGGRLTSVR